ALGSCACYGGVAFQKNQFEIDDVVQEVYGADKVDTMKTVKIGDVVQVDLSIPGCPVSKEEVEKIVVDVVTGVDIRMPNYPVCVECKQNGNTCVVDMGQICLGPITRAGCGAVCPNHKVGCLGCRGPVECAKIDSLMDILKERGHTESQIMERVSFYNTFSEVINS
ncbi:MAG: NADH:ubiquinone oxidoreductase, partial [Planctomycetes bacterium]|nr:NADH:ubiquinone oxidoreductase [Planctomycetota bacterium]